MGDYLKEAYLQAEINRNIGNRYQKLFVKYNDLLLLNARMVRLLRRTLDYIDSLGWIESDLCQLQNKRSKK